MGFKIGICGVSHFGSRFVPLFRAHPDIDEVVIADLDPDRVAKAVRENHLRRSYSSFRELLQTDVDAIAIFTSRWTHAPLAIEALKQGKHVYSAVPAAISIAELEQLIETVQSTGMLYMMGETDYYQAPQLYCRQRFQAGNFGRFVYAESRYNHNMAQFYKFFWSGGGENWVSQASFPPMFYSTHMTGQILSVTRRRMTQTSCIGFVDHHPDGVFAPGVSAWDNVFSNETALYATSDGGSARVCEHRRVSAHGTRLNVFGTLGSFESQYNQTGAWSTLVGDEAYDEAGQFDYAKVHLEQARHELEILDLTGGNPEGVGITEANLGDLPREYLGRTHLDVSPYHDVQRLPADFVGLGTGHGGAHQFLVVDFIEALKTSRLPPVNVWTAARYTAPGIVAHASALKDGETLSIPDLGRPPDDAKYLRPNTELLD